MQIYVVLKSFKDRQHDHQTLQGIMADLEKRTAGVLEADIKVIQPPSVRGIGTAGGFKLVVEDRNRQGVNALSIQVCRRHNRLNSYMC